MTHVDKVSISAFLYIYVCVCVCNCFNVSYYNIYHQFKQELRNQDEISLKNTELKCGTNHDWDLIARAMCFDFIFG